MRTDVKISNEDYNFKLRVNGIIIINDKVLSLRMNDNDFYCLPGGHIELGEDSKEAALRELAEEVGCQFKDNLNLVSMVENFFVGKGEKIFHEVSFYYVLEPLNMQEINTNNYTIIENDKGVDVKLEFKWIPLNEIDQETFRPANIQQKLKNRDFSLEHKIINQIKK